MTALLRTAPVLALALVAAGCLPQRQARVVAALPPQPSAPVEAVALPPPPTAPIAQEPLPGTTPPLDAAAPAAPAQVSRADLVGGWGVTASGQTCQLFMSLTTWTGGYRASTRGCSDPTLAGVSAWDVAGSTVTLKGGDGATTVATLTASGPTTFNGSLSGGGPVTVAR